ncbi:MAG: hypothetical protein ABJJ14_02340 [Cyclobacteriaceae bacterium]
MISIVSVLALSAMFACQTTSQKETRANPYTEELKEYWFSGEAELTSYELKQARYGEIREGKSVLIFVTEDFSSKTMTKADNPTKDNFPILKLNNTRKFNTGIYPYSMMTSTFFPFPDGENSIKVSTSSQEWCGHTYLELIDKGDFEIQNHSYFQSEAKKKITLDKDILEDDLWSRIRINPDDLPTGTHKVIPSFFFLRLSHNDIKAYSCDLNLHKKNDSLSTYQISYPELERNLKITFESAFPFKIVAWEDTHYSGYGESRKKLTTSATAIKTIRSQYWSKNSNADVGLRGELGLE